MKKNTVLIIFLFLGMNISFSQVSKEMLELHKTGIYSYKEDGSGFEVERTKGKQYEYSTGKNKMLIFKVKWVSDDTYHLIYKGHKDFPSHYKKGDVMVVKIISADKDKYTCSWELNTIKSTNTLYRKN